jgi:hypothetical protein
VVGRYSYRLQPGATLAPNEAGLDPLSVPSAFNCGLRQDLEALFVPGQAPRESPSPSAEVDASMRDGSVSDNTAAALQDAANKPALSEPKAERAMPATALSDRIRSSLDLLHRHTVGSAVPDLRSIHRRMPSLSGTDPDSAGSSEEKELPVPK